MDDCFATIIQNDDHYVLVSIQISDAWEVRDILDWIEDYEITLHPPTTETIREGGLLHHTSNYQSAA
jgi:hypothetical protein